MERTPASFTTIRSESVSSRRRSSMSRTGFCLITADREMNDSASPSGSAAAVEYASTLEAAIPSNQSRPSAPQGASPTSAAVRVTRSGISAAQASACDAPPERPTTANLSSPMWSAMARTSSTTSATRRPGSRSEPPYPGRS